MEIDRTRAVQRANLFGGEGTVWVQSLHTGALPSPFTVALLCELEGAGRVGAHSQATDSEIILGLAGEAVLYVDKRAHPVRPGTVVGLPFGSTLEIDNASPSSPFRYLIIKGQPRSAG